MTRPDTAVHPAPDAAGARSRRADGVIRAAAGVTVVGLAGVAGAISYSHMRALAAAHGEAGWQAHTFPLSVDGIEIVASLVLLADRRAGRASGWLPWAALVAGTTASLAANVAAADADVIGRVVAGWPAFALLVAVKLCSRLLEPRSGGDGRPVLTVGDRGGADARPPVGGKGTAAVAGGGPVAGRDARRHVPGHASGGDGGDAAAVSTGPPSPPTVGDGTDVAGLLPAARAAAGRVVARDGTLTRDGLAAQLRLDGHPVRNATVSHLLTALRRDPAAGPVPAPAGGADARPALVGAAAGGDSDL
jgi:Protein of unknown function (DUF2637)